MPDRIKVCQVLSNYVVGGAEMVALDIARGLDPERFESLVVTVIEPDGPDEPEMRRRFREAGIPTFALHHRNFRDPRTLWDMARFFRRQRPDILHGHKRFSDAWACRVGRWAGVPHRIWTRHSVYRDMNARQLRRYRTLAPRTPVVVAVSDVVRQNCLQTEGLPAALVRTVVNGIDTERFAPRAAAERAAIRAALGVEPDEQLLLFVGRLSEEKAPEAFPPLVARLAAQGLAVRGFMCGDGPLAARVRAAAAGTPVTLLGVRRDIPELLAACDLLVSTSRVEGLPLNIMEAMAAGAAFVGPDLDQVLQLVTGEPDLAAGVYPRPPDRGPVPDDQLARWAALTAARLADADGRQRSGRRGRAVIGERFSLDRMVRTYAGIYEDIVAGRLRPAPQ
ncbi:MAG: glycosyltransferase [Candidatus Krumholzibacteriia bacterium]